MRKITVLMATAAILLTVFAGTAMAAIIVGNDGPNRLVGTPQNDTLRGLGGADVLIGRGDGDAMFGGAGADRFPANDGESDRIVCGAGRDTVVADRDDRVAADCENVTRRPDPGDRPDGPDGPDDNGNHGPNHQ